MLGNSGTGLLCLVMGDGAVLEGLSSPPFDQNGCMPGHQSAWHVTLRFEVACVRPEHERMNVRPVKAFPVSSGELGPTECESKKKNTIDTHKTNKIGQGH